VDPGSAGGEQPGAHQPRELSETARLCRAAMDHGAMQKPEELDALIEILQGERLGTVVEIGTAGGGTLLGWCALARADATIVSIDLPGGPFGGSPEDRSPILRSFAAPGQALHLLRMDSARRRTYDEVQRLLGDRRIDLLYIDGDHSYYGVRTDLLLYAPLVREGGLVVLHDINSASSDPAVEVEYLWQQLKATWEWREIVHQEPPPTYGGFGVLRWKARTEIAALDPSPDGGRFALAGEFRESPSEPVFDLQTPVGSLLVPEADRSITQEFFNGAVAESATAAFLRSTLRAGQTFVDVGARLG
jgi:predicted O-methyltransferase YrrM